MNTLLLYPIPTDPALNFPGRRSLWSRLAGFAAAALGFLLIVNSSTAMTVIPPSFQELVASSTQVLRVEVTGVSTRWDPSANGKLIHTYVQCTILKTLKGTPANSITLRLLGGQVGDVHFEVPGMPTFEVGHTYVVFVAGNGSAFCPIVAATHGSFPIVTDASTHEEHVLGGNRQPLLSVDEVSVPMPDAAGRSPTTAIAGAGLSRADFEDSISREVARENAH